MKIFPLSRIRKFESLHPDSLVRIYSYQGKEAMESLRDRGYISGNSEYIENEGDWPQPYAWMRDQMRDRIPDFSGDYPVWAWLKRPSTKPKPRKYRGTKEDNRVIAMVPRSRILLSDYDLWHMPLNNSPVCDTEEEFDNQCNDPVPTWNRIFSWPDKRTNEETSWLGSLNRLRVQACVDRIYEHEIVSTRTMG